MAGELVGAAFCSNTRNQCYVFNKEKFCVVDYSRGVQPKNRLLNGPVLISVEFPMFDNTQFQNGIDGSFANHLKEAFFFCGDECAKADFAPNTVDAKLLSGPMPIKSMFPSLTNTVFASGITAAMKSNNDKTVFLFSGDQCGLLDFTSGSLIETKSISEAFPQFVGTVFESGLDAALNTHDKNEAYVFKGEYYAHFNLTTRAFISGFIRKIRTDWPALTRLF